MRHVEKGYRDKMKISVVMVSDKNYISQTRVTIWTMKKNISSKVLLEITIFCSQKLDKESRNRLQELECIFTNLKINFYDVDEQLFKDAKTMDHIPITSLYRLVIGEVIKEDKCIFLDGDIIVNSDLADLFTYDMEDFYIAGVRDAGFFANPDKTIAHEDMYQLKMSEYINAGVMIFNLLKIREENLQQQFIESIKNNYIYMDQDILNKVCAGKVKLLDERFNLINKNLNIKSLPTILKSSKGYILHFAGATKPWTNIRIRGAEEWWRWAKEALEDEEYKKMYDLAVQKTEESDWSYIIERCINIKNINVIGCSRIGIEVFEALKKCNLMADISLCDNSMKKQELSNDYLTICSVEDLVEKHPNAIWINTSQKYYREINSQLIGLGIAENQIITYMHKEEGYFSMLDDEYIDYELSQLKYKITGNLN